jgi:hypothetical protein
VLAILFDSFAKKVLSVKMVFLLCEGDARRVDRGSCRDHSEYETPINHKLAPFGKWLYAHNVVRISCRHCDQVSFVIWTEPPMNGPTTDKFQRFPIADSESDDY